MNVLQDRQHENNEVASSEKLTISSMDPKNPSKKTTGAVNRKESVKVKRSPTKFGKANLIRDVILLVSFFGIAIYLTSDYGKPKELTEKSEIDPVTQLTDMVKNLARDATSKRRKDPCSIYLHTGTIPNTGLSYIAGRNYTVGEILSLYNYPTIYPITNNNKDIYVPTSTLILKHHPILFNVEGVLYYDDHDNTDILTSMQLRVTKPITIGEEFFVEYDDKIHSSIVFNHIPSISDYELTRDIAMDALRSVSDRQERNGRVTCRMVPVMQYVKRTVHRFNPTIASLVPDTQFKANQFRNELHSSIAAITQKHLLKNLQQFAICLDDVQQQQQALLPEQTQNDDNSTFTSVQRNIRKGEIIMTLPLYIMPLLSSQQLLTTQDTISDDNNNNNGTCDYQEQDCTVSSSSMNCFTNNNLLSVLLCPLGPIIEHVVFLDDTIIPTIVNVEYQWSKHRAVQSFAMHDLYRYSTSVMAWDVIALRDISIGEKLIVHQIPTDIPEKMKMIL